MSASLWAEPDSVAAGRMPAARQARDTAVAAASVRQSANRLSPVLSMLSEPSKGGMSSSTSPYSTTLSSNMDGCAAGSIASLAAYDATAASASDPGSVDEEDAAAAATGLATEPAAAGPAETAMPSRVMMTPRATGPRGGVHEGGNAALAIASSLGASASPGGLSRLPELTLEESESSRVLFCVESGSVVGWAEGSPPVPPPLLVAESAAEPVEVEDPLAGISASPLFAPRVAIAAVTALSKGGGVATSEFRLTPRGVWWW